MIRHYLDGSDWQAIGWHRNEWRFTHSMELGEMLTPPVAPLPATVPGAIQADLLAAGLISDPRFGLCSRESEWVNNREWFLEKEFSVAPELLAPERRITLVCEGLDPAGLIFLNGEQIGTFESMMLPVEIDVTGMLRGEGNRLRFVLFQTPEIDGQYGYTDRIELIRSRFNYIWDWCPRIIPTGAWKSVYLEASGAVRVTQPGVCTTRQGSEWKVDTKVHLECLVPDEYTLRYEVISLGGEGRGPIAAWEQKHQVTRRECELSSSVVTERAESWWPRGYGAQPLYELVVSVVSEGEPVSQARTRFGFRTVELLKNPGSSESALAYTLSVNGRPLFMKGVNWVPAEPWYGTVRRERYEQLLQRFAEMGCNMLRVWGGAFLETDDFYSVADEMGLLIWQEFPQSSSGINNFPNSSARFLKQMELVATHYVTAVRNHPSLAIWCGGNELMDSGYRPVGVGHPTIRLLADLVHKHSPWIPFLPASPSGPQFVALSDSIGKDRHHDVHGPWKFEPPGHYELFNAEDSLIRTETGAPGHARMEALRHYADGNALWPPATTNPYWTHRGAWWIDYGPMTAFFGEFGEGAAAEGEFAHYLRLQRYLQAEALRYAAEATRRRAPRASGFLVWMGNEPFPNASNTSVIEYDGAPKPAHAALARSFAPVIATARYARMSYEIGERVEAEIAVVEDPGEHAVSGTVSWSLRKMDGGLLGEGAVEFNTNGDGAAQTVGRVGAEATERGVVILRVLTDIKGRQPLVHDYYFVVRESGEPRYAPLRDAPVARVEVRAEVSPAEGRETGSRPSQASRRLRLSNGGDVCALGVFLCGAVGAASISAAPNFLSLFPGESAVVDVTGGNPGWSESNVIVDWINA